MAWWWWLCCGVRLTAAAEREQPLLSYLQRKVVLCVGDSLTKGKWSNGTSPYANTLREGLRGQRTGVVEVGNEGDRTYKIFQRLPLELMHYYRPRGRGRGVVGLVAIWGGMEDLLVGSVHGRQVLANLVAIHQLVHEYVAAEGRTVTLAMTIPRCAAFYTKKKTFVEEKRQFVNQGLRDFAKKNPSRVLLLDVGELRWERGFYSQDGCHLNDRGYAAIGTLILELIKRTAWVPPLPASSTPRLPLCGSISGGDGKEAEGQWHLNTSFESKSFVCCGGGNALNKTRGWLDVDAHADSKTCPLEHSLPFNLQSGVSAQCGDDCCSCDRHANTRYSPSLRESWFWRYRSCRLEDWNARNFCNLLRGPLLMVGDSTMQQAWSTLVSMVKSGGGECHHNIYFGISPFLETSPPPFSWNVSRFLNAMNVSVDVLVVSAGAHLKDMGDLVTIFDLLHKDLELQQQRTPHPSLIFWRGQVPGHILCDKIVRPAPYPYGHQDTEQDIIRYDKFKWRLFHQFDKYAREELARRSSKIKFLDLHPLYYRPDGHVVKGLFPGGRPKPHADCLHSCMPGPLNYFSQALLHALAVERLGSAN